MRESNLNYGWKNRDSRAVEKRVAPKPMGQDPRHDAHCDDGHRDHAGRAGVQRDDQGAIRPRRWPRSSSPRPATNGAIIRPRNCAAPWRTTRSICWRPPARWRRWTPAALPDADAATIAALTQNQLPDAAPAKFDGRRAGGARFGGEFPAGSRNRRGLGQSETGHAGGGR